MGQIASGPYFGGVTTWKVQIFLLSKILELVASIKYSLYE